MVEKQSYSTDPVWTFWAVQRRPPRSISSDGDWADEDSNLQQDAENEEHKVQYEHGEAQRSAHLPATGGNGDGDEEEHEEEQHNGAKQAVGADCYGLSIV